MANILPRSRCTQFLSAIGVALCVMLPWIGAEADDLDIYTNPTPPADQAPITMLALDLNLLDVGTVACQNILLPQPAPPQVPAAPNVDCYALQQALSVNQLLAIIGTLPGNLTGGVTGVLISTLPSALLEQTVATALQTTSLLTPIFNTLGTVLASNNLLGTLTSTLPVYLALSNILHGLVNSRIGIMLNHSDQAAAPAPARCGFLDQSSLGGERQDTPACSNGGYIFVGLVDATQVDALLTRLLPLLTGAVGNLLGNGVSVGVDASAGTGASGTSGSVGFTGLAGKAPYQTKELYAEFMEYLAGGPSFNGKLDAYDNVLAKALARDQSASVETANHRNYVSALQRYPLACNINFLHVQLTPAARQDDSDAELRRYLPEAQVEADGTLSLATVVNNAANNGFVYAGDRRRIKSYFLVQESIGNLADLSAVAGLGSNVTTYSNVLGLVSRGRDIAGAMLKPLSVDTSLTSLAVASSRSTATGILTDAYLSAFRADVDQKPDWHGDLKKLGLKLRNPKDAKQLVDVVDANGMLAVDSNGRVKNNALTFWTDAAQLGTGVAADGPVADLGGAGQKIPGFKFGGGGNPGRSNPASNAIDAAGTRTLYFDSYSTIPASPGNPVVSGARLAALNPDVAIVRTELTSAMGATGFSSGNSACSTACNNSNSTCLNQCNSSGGSCSNICVGNQNSCNSTCGVGQGVCASRCGSDLNSCIANADGKQTSCNSNAASKRTQCNSNAANTQAMCVLPASTVQTTCNVTASTNRTTCNTAALTAKTTRDTACLGNPTCLANSNTTYNAAVAQCTTTYNSDTTTCTNNYNNSTAPCTAAYNSSITACTNTFNTDTAQCSATRTSEVNACNSTNNTCTGSCSSDASSCGLTCGVTAGSCTNVCTGNNNSCNANCSAQLGSCQASCGVDTTRTTDTEVKELLLYARGFDVGTLASPKGSGSTPATKTDSGIGSRPWMMGAVLHSKPVAINYGKRKGAAVDDVRVVFGSADGYLRMVRNDNGIESWGFMPQSVMGNLRGLRENVAGTALPYGVDGSPVVLIRDRPGNNADLPAASKGKLGVIGDNTGRPDDPATPNVDESDGDRVLVIFGLRRGGSAYYALDVTDPDHPTLAWRLTPEGLLHKNQTSVDSGTAAQFASLGLAFSTPQVGRVMIDADGDPTTAPEPHTVLIFGGGYNGGRSGVAKVGKDLNNSRNTLSTAQVGLDDGSGSSDRGNALFMIDAATGQLLWRAVRSTTAAAVPATTSNRTYMHPMLVDSIASDVTALDTDNDGYTDRVYVGDTGGRLWRADLPGVLPSAWTITPIASVGRHSGSSTLANDRRIFFAPDYVPVRDVGTRKGSDLILFGTGDREDPLNLVTQNSFYAYRDPDIVSGKAAADIITTEENLKLAKQSDFADVTTLSGEALKDLTDPTFGSKGYRVNYTRSGEKHFSAPVTLGGNTTFTTYVPPDASAAGGRVCAPTEGSSRLYSLAARNSKALGVNGLQLTTRDASLGDGLPGEINTLAGTQQSAGALIYAVPTRQTYRASWREVLGETQK